MTSSVETTGKRREWLLACLPLLLLMLAIWRPLALPDEGRYAEVARWMLVSGDWLTPRLDGVPFFHKPPLLYWLEAGSMTLFGATPWAARLVVMGHAMLMWGLMLACARQFAGETVARRAAWILGSSLAFLIGGQYINHDMMVATWMGVAIWCSARALLHESGVHAGWARMGFVACALGVLSKGLIGLLLPGLVLVLWVTWARLWRKVWSLPWISGALLFVCLALPWFVLAARAHPEMLAYMFGTHQFGRYTATTFNNARPWWFYGVAVTVLLFPWVFFAAADGVQRLGGLLRRSSGRAAAAPWESLCWIWVLAILGFFSIPNSKLIGYALPVMPPLALLAAWGWQQQVASRAWASRSFAGLVALALGMAVAGDIAAARYTDKRSSRDVAAVLACLHVDGDVVAVLDEFPYDLPFYAQLEQPMEVVQDWEFERRNARDNWRRELFEGAEFDAQAARVLVPLERSNALRGNPRAWVLAPVNSSTLSAQQHEGFSLVSDGRAWRLFQGVPPTDASSGSAASKSPEAAQNESLGRCKNQGHEQR